MRKDTAGTHLQSELSLNADFEKFAQKLENNKQKHKFIKCITTLANGTLPFTNIVWKSFLKMGSLLPCMSTANIVYDKEWLEFCQVIYHMFRAGVINTLCGRGHFSQVMSEKIKKGQYNPITGEFNFLIPSYACVF